MLNPYIGKPMFLYSPDDDVVSALRSLPEIDRTRHYYLLAVNLEEEVPSALPDGVTFVGHDVADETRTSSLLNCGPWKGKLLPITKRLNQYGLLSLDDAQLAQQLLPEEWGEEEPHACVDIWALYDVTNLYPSPFPGVTEP